MRPLILVLLLVSTGAGAGPADPFVGRFQGEANGQQYRLSLARDVSGRYEGSLTLAGQHVSLTGERRGDEVVGDVKVDGSSYQFVISLRGGGTLFFEGEESDPVLFRPVAAGNSSKPGAQTAKTAEASVNDKSDDDWPVKTKYPKANASSSTPPKSATGAVRIPDGDPESARAASVSATTSKPVINGRELTEREIVQLRRMGIQVPPGAFWYDPVCGAWGPAGGPTMGFIAAGLAIGGALQANASGGGTQVFVNGREIHPYDLMALQQIAGQILPGRYFINSQGLAGFEGGPPMWNLVAMAAQSRRGGGGGSNSWQSALGSGFSDGANGAVFLPNGGISSYGSN